MDKNAIVTDVDRSEVFRLIKEYAKRTGKNYALVWGMLYGSIYYELHVDVYARSKNSRVRPVTVIDCLGIWGMVKPIAVRLFA